MWLVRAKVWVSAWDHYGRYGDFFSVKQYQIRNYGSKIMNLGSVRPRSTHHFCSAWHDVVQYMSSVCIVHKIEDSSSDIDHFHYIWHNRILSACNFCIAYYEGNQNCTSYVFFPTYRNLDEPSFGYMHVYKLWESGVEHYPFEEVSNFINSNVRRITANIEGRRRAKTRHFVALPQSARPVGGHCGSGGGSSTSHN